MANPWDVPYAVKFKTGDPTPDEIYFAVGKCLSKWESVEENLTDLFVLVTGGSDPWHYVPAARAYGSIVSAIARAEMISQAAEAFFHYHESFEYRSADNLKLELKKLVLEYTGWGARRNDNAHGKVVERPDIGGVGHTTFLLLPSPGNSRKWPVDWKPAYQYTATQIESFGVQFEAVAQRVEDFTARLCVWQKTSPKKPIES